MSVPPKVMAAPAAEPPLLVVSIATAPVVNATVLLKITLSPEVVKFTPAIVAGLATVNALLKREPVVANVTPVPPAVRVVMPVIVPPPETPFTVIVPVPAAVMFNEPAVMLLSSLLSSSRSPKALPKFTFTSTLLVMLTAPATLMAAPITTSPAPRILSDKRGVIEPTRPKKEILEAAVKVRSSAPSSFSPNLIVELVVINSVSPVRIVSTKNSIEPAVRVPPLEFKPMPEALFNESAPKIVPLAANVIVPAVTLSPPMVRLVNSLPPTEVNMPVRLIGAVANVVKSSKLVKTWSAEIPLATITMPGASVAVRVRVTPPTTTTESLILKKPCVALALMLVEFPDPFTVKLPVPTESVMFPSTLNSPAPPERKLTVTALGLIHAAATVIAPTLFAVLPSTTDETVG